MKGFTLIEILIVVILLGILAAIVVPMFTDASDDTRVSTCQANMATIRGQAELFRAKSYGIDGVLGTADDASVYPGSTAVMVTANLLQEDTVCPVDSAAYVLGVVAGHLTVTCPNDTDAAGNHDVQ